MQDEANQDLTIYQHSYKTHIAYSLNGVGERVLPPLLGGVLPPLPCGRSSHPCSGGSSHPGLATLPPHIH